MTDRELRRLSRKELIEIIYEMKKSELALKERNAALEKQLSDRSIQIQNAGSIAEAALALSGIFEAAQDAADRYLGAVRASVQQPPRSELPKAAESDLDALLREAESLLTPESEKEGGTDA